MVKEAAVIERKGHLPPEKLKYSIETTKRKIKKFQEQLVQSQSEKEDAIASFNEDLRRYRELSDQSSGN